MGLPTPFPSGGLIQAKTNIGFQRNLWIPGAFDYNMTEEHWDGDAIDDKYPSAKTNGTSAAVTYTEHTPHYLSLVTGTDDNGYAGQGMGMQWSGDRGVLFETLFTTPSAITTLKFEFGLSDADDDAGAVNLKATPTGTATDFAVFCFDTDDDTNLAFITSMSGALVATQDISSVAIAASTTYYMAILVKTNSVKAWACMAGSLPTQVSSGTHLIEGGTALTPWGFAQARAGSASRTVLWNKWRCTEPAYT